MAKNLSKMSLAFATFAMTSIAFMSQVAAQSYEYSYEYSDGNPIIGIIIACCGLIFAIVIPLLIGYLVYKDAQKNNVDNPMLWAILCGIFGLIPLLIYFLAIRNKA